MIELSFKSKPFNLLDLKCPKCKSRNVRILMLGFFSVNENGTVTCYSPTKTDQIDPSHLQWNDESNCMCADCNYFDTVYDFLPED